MNAIHGGTAQHDTIDAPTIAVRRRGGMCPQAYVYPADMRAPRDLLRRRRPLGRHQAELVTHVQHTHRQDHRPEIGQKIAYQANRDGGAERFPDPAVPQSSAVDRALSGPAEARLRDLEWAMSTTAKPHDANTLSWRQTVPGLGKLLRLVRWDEMPDIARFPRVQACVSSGRLVKGAKASAGTR
jgi:hypothetical protein